MVLRERYWHTHSQGGMRHLGLLRQAFLVGKFANVRQTALHTFATKSAHYRTLSRHFGSAPRFVAFAFSVT